MNTYAIADLHGRLDLLGRAMVAITNHAQGPCKLVVLGDFVDRGPQSRQIIDLLMKGPEIWPDIEFIVLQGNHEDIMLQAIKEPGLLKWWIGNGGGATLKSYGYTDGDQFYPLKVNQSHIDWLSKLPISYEDDLRMFVHAGVPYNTPMHEAKKETLQWMLYRGDIEKPFGADIYDDLPHFTGKHLVHGHHQSRDHPLLKPHRTNLDSFAWLYGRLAIGVFNDSQAGPVEVLEVQGEIDPRL
jgi:serine/threonine protein phosphatase 1